MARHRGRFDASKSEPYEVSRGKLEAFLNCPACFWLERARGIKFPSIPGFLLNTNTDTLLKKDFDQCRGERPHPVMMSAGLQHLRPFAHPDMSKWVNSMQFGAGPEYFNALHSETNFLFGGGVDDVWEDMNTGLLYIVDYKSTSQQRKVPMPLDESFIAAPESPDAPDYKAGYRRQMDMYQWILRRKGFEVSDVGYFVYVDGLHQNIDGMIDAEDPKVAWMKFQVAVIPYQGDDSWVADALIRAKRCLLSADSPPHSQGCEFGNFLKAALPYGAKSTVD